LSADVNNKLIVSGKLSTPVTDKTTSFGPKTLSVTVLEPDSDRNVAVTRGKTGAGVRFSTGKSGKSDGSENVISGSVPDNPRNSLAGREKHFVKAGNDRKTDAKSIAEQVSNKTSSRNKSEPVEPRQAVTENGVKLDRKKQTSLQNKTVSGAVAVGAAKRDAKDTGNGTRQNVKCQNNQTVMLQSVSVEHGNRTKLPDATASRDSALLATSTPRNSADTSMVCNDFVASDKNLSYVVDTNVGCQEVVGNSSARADVGHTVVVSLSLPVSEKQASTEAARPQVNVSDSAAHPSSPLTGWSIGRRASVDLFDVAIAGTPAQYASADDSSDNLLSPFSVDVANEGVDAACSAVAEFVVPGNPTGEMVDASLRGKCALHSRKLLSLVGFKFIN